MNRDSFYWGGPVSQNTVRALLHTNTPPENAEQVFDSVYLVDINEDLLATEADSSTLRFFAGYAGWSAGQLQSELAFNSWLIVPAKEALVFAKDTTDIWFQLIISQQYRAAIFHGES
jgi:putative transcriptional regulator